MAKTKSIALPLPKTWVTTKEWGTKTPSARDQAISGKELDPGSRSYLDKVLVANGWDHGIYRQRANIEKKLFDPLQEGRDAKLDSIVSTLRKDGYNVDPVQDGSWVRSLWETYSTNPWWTVTDTGQKAVCVIAKTSKQASAASAAFILNLHDSLGEAPTSRMPPFRRLNMATLMSPQVLHSISESLNESIELLVLEGGLLEEDFIYQTFSYLSAVRSSFNGFIFYEAVVPPSADLKSVARAAKRSGFSAVLGVA